MKEIILDNSLEINEREFDKFNPKYFFENINNFEPLTNINADIIHRNYLDYLTLCWKRHYGVIISPTILWNIVLSNLAFEVNQRPKTYRKYFSESEKKQEICVRQGGKLISTELLINGLNGYVPSDIMEHCFPNFTTNNEKSKIANYTAFLDMVSPYYNYSMFLCGIPKIKILGSKEDWYLFIDNCLKISKQIPEFITYLLKVSNRITTILEEIVDYSNFFSLQKCGSGSQLEVNGWITEFFIEQPKVPYLNNFIPCISKIDYHNYNDGNDYRLYAGLFSSIIKDSYLIPDFDNIYFKKIK